jgi:hypothetical protein
MPSDDSSPLVAEAIHNYFVYKSERFKRSFSLLLLEGGTSLMIGLSFFAMSVFGTVMLTGFANNTFLRLLKESLLISGWVEKWRPIQIFIMTGGHLFGEAESIATYVEQP